MPVRTTIDRIEGAIAIVEIGGAHIEVPVSDLPSGAGEGDALSLCFTVIPHSNDEAAARLNRLKQAGPKGDSIDL